MEALGCPCIAFRDVGGLEDHAGILLVFILLIISFFFLLLLLLLSLFLLLLLLLLVQLLVALHNLRYVGEVRPCLCLFPNQLRLESKEVCPGLR